MCKIGGGDRSHKPSMLPLKAYIQQNMLKYFYVTGTPISYSRNPRDTMSIKVVRHRHTTHSEHHICLDLAEAGN